MTILYIEDDYEYHNMVDFMLEPMNVKTLHAYSVQEGIDMLKSNKVNFILSDINMEGMDGLSFLTAIKSDVKLNKIPVVIVTGEPSGDKARFANEHGAVGFLAKPFTQNELTYLVKTFAILGNVYSIEESTEEILMRKKQKLMMTLAKDSLERDFNKACKSFIDGLNDIFDFDAMAFFQLNDENMYEILVQSNELKFPSELSVVHTDITPSVATLLGKKVEVFNNDALNIKYNVLKSFLKAHSLNAEVLLPFFNLDERDFLLGAGEDKSDLTMSGFFWGFRNGILSSKESEILKRLAAQGNPILSHLKATSDFRRSF